MRRFILPLFLVTGCMVGPKYQAPEPKLPASFEEAHAHFQSTADEEIGQWWKEFHDPDLDELLEEAITANYDIRIALEKIEQARAQYRIEKAYLWPEIDLNATVLRNRISQSLLPDVRNVDILPTFLNIFQIGFDAIWELDFFGRLRHNRNAAEYTLEAMQEEAEGVVISMLSEVAVNYVSVRSLQRQIELTEQKLELDQKELSIMKQLFQIGLANELQVLTILSNIETDRSTLPPLKTSLKQSAYALAYLIGKEPEGLMKRLEEPRDIPSGIARVPAGLPSDLLRRRHDIRSAERRLAAATEQVGSAVAELFPRISLTGVSLGSGGQPASSAGLESDRIGTLFKGNSAMFSVGPNINWNVIDFGKLRGNIDVQNSLQRQALLSYEQTVIASLKDVESALTAYFEEQKKKASLTMKVEADQSSWQITKDLYRIGLANELQVIQAEKAFLSSEMSLTTSDQALTSDLIALYKSLGGCWRSETLSK